MRAAGASQWGTEMNVVLLGAANPETGRIIKAVEKSVANFRVIGFIDNDPKKKGTPFLGYPVFGGFECLGDLVKDGALFVNLITGSTRVRHDTTRFMIGKGCKFTNLVHPSVDLMMIRLGFGNYIQDHVIIQAGSVIGNNCSIHVGSIVAHEVTLGESVFVAHGCSISGCVEIGEGSFIGTNATVLPRIKIGKWAVVGAGAVVTKDVPDNTTVVGNPARAMKASP